MKINYFPYFFLSIIILELGACSSIAQTPTVPFLELNQAINTEIKAGESNSYFVKMKSDETAIVRIERVSFEIGEEINVLVTVYSPTEEIIAEINTANDASFVLFDSKESGNYKILVRRWNGAQFGSYRIQLDFLKQKASNPTEQIHQILSYFYPPHIPGAAVAILEKGRTKYLQTFGLSNMEHNTPVQPNTIFDIASISKQFTAFAIAMLADQGKIELNESIRNYLPEFQTYGDQISILQLILNLSGIKDYDPALALAGYTEEQHDVMTKERILKAIYQYESTYFSPGSQYNYSNAGYFLLTQIIEKATGQSYADWMTKNIFQPLDMNESYVYQYNRAIHPNLSASYKKEEGYYDHIQVDNSVYKYQSKHLDIGTIHTTIIDFTKWVNNYKTGKVGGQKVLEIIEQGINDDPNAWNWAFGFQKFKYKGLPSKKSEGLLQGYRCYNTIFPEQDISIIYLTNDGEWRSYYLARTIQDIYLREKLEQQVIVSRYDKTKDIILEEEPENPVHFTTELTSFEGSYFNKKLNVGFDIKLKDEILQATNMAYKSIILTQIEANLFTSNNWFSNKIEFVRDPENEITACKIFNQRDGNFFLFKKLN